MELETEFICEVCEVEEVPPKRWDLGYRCCLKCGAKKAQEQAHELTKRVGQVANKMGYQLISRDDVKTMGKKV
jgi:hypothetical protein